MSSPTVDYILGDALMHAHKAADVSDLTTTLDTLYVNTSGDLMTGALKGYITVDILSNILALTPTGNQLAYASDTSEFYLYTGSVWKVAPLELSTRSATPDMGAYTQTQGQGISDPQGYYDTAITDKLLHNCAIKSNGDAIEGSVRTTTTGYFQIYLNARWNTVVINFVFREDSTGTHELEHQPVGFNFYYEIMSGNSDALGIDGKPIIQQYSADMGAFQSDLVIDFGTF